MARIQMSYMATLWVCGDKSGENKYPKLKEIDEAYVGVGVGEVIGGL